MARLRVSDAYLDHAFVKFDTVRGPKQAPFAPIRAFLCRSDLYGGFVRARGALKQQELRFPAPRAAAGLVHDSLLQKVTSPRFTILNAGFRPGQSRRPSPWGRQPGTARTTCTTCSRRSRFCPGGPTAAGRRRSRRRAGRRRRRRASASSAGRGRLAPQFICKHLCTHKVHS